MPFKSINLINNLFIITSNHNQRTTKNLQAQLFLKYLTQLHLALLKKNHIKIKTVKKTTQLTLLHSTTTKPFFKKNKKFERNIKKFLYKIKNQSKILIKQRKLQFKYKIRFQELLLFRLEYPQLLLKNSNLLSLPKSLKKMILKKLHYFKMTKTSRKKQNKKRLLTSLSKLKNQHLFYKEKIKFNKMTRFFNILILNQIITIKRLI